MPKPRTSFPPGAGGGYEGNPDDVTADLKSFHELHRAVLAYKSEMESPAKDPTMAQQRRCELFDLVS